LYSLFSKKKKVQFCTTELAEDAIFSSSQLNRNVEGAADIIRANITLFFLLSNIQNTVATTCEHIFACVIKEADPG